MSWAAILLAVALLIMPGAAGRHRIAACRSSGVAAPAVRDVDDRLAAASTFELFAACLSAGMAVSSAAAAAAPSAPRAVRTALNRASELLALGADPVLAWSDDQASDDKNTEALLRMARRSAVSGHALAHGVAELAAQVRQDAATASDAAAERASVLIAGPLGLCFLPAFVCLGIVPVVVGLAGDVLGSGLL